LLCHGLWGGIARVCYSYRLTQLRAAALLARTGQPQICHSLTTMSKSKITPGIGGAGRSGQGRGREGRGQSAGGQPESRQQKWSGGSSRPASDARDLTAASAPNRGQLIEVSETALEEDGAFLTALQGWETDQDWQRALSQLTPATQEREQRWVSRL
jgi:hypothetical protein